MIYDKRLITRIVNDDCEEIVEKLKRATYIVAELKEILTSVEKGSCDMFSYIGKGLDFDYAMNHVSKASDYIEEIESKLIEEKGETIIEEVV